MKKLFLLLILLMPGICFAQQGNQSIPANGGQHGSSAPSGACAAGGLYTNDVNGNLYSCNAGTWKLIGSGAPAFSAITGSTNTTAAMVLGSGSSLTTSGTGTLNTANGIVGGGLALYPAANDGVDHCAQINTKMLAAANGQIVDDSGAIGFLPCGTNPWNGVTNHVHLKLGCGAEYDTTVSWVISNQSHLLGCGVNNANGDLGSTITAVSGFSTAGTPVVEMGTSPNGDMEVLDVNISCNAIANAIGIRNLNASAGNTVVSRVNISYCPNRYLDVETANTEFSRYDEIHLISGNEAVAGTVFFYGFNTFGLLMTDIFPDAISAHKPTNCMVLDEFSGTLINIETEQCTNGMLLGTTGNSSFGIDVIGFTGGLGTTNGIVFDTNANSNPTVYNLQHILNANAGAVAISDSIFGSNTLLNNVAEYFIDEKSGGNAEIFCMAQTTCNSTIRGNIKSGVDNSVAGALVAANGSASAHTNWTSAATTTNTIAGFASVPTTGHVVDCTVSSTTCTMHDSGLVTANVLSSGGALGTPSSGTGTNITGIQNVNVSAAPVPTPGTSVTLTAPRGYAICTGTCTVSVPVPAAGYEFCILNDDNVSTAITLSALGSSAMYENSARTAYGTAGTGTLALSAAAANKVCLVGRDATHYLTVSFNGAVTVN